MHRSKLLVAVAPLAAVAALAALGSAGTLAGSFDDDSVYTGCLKAGALHSVAVGRAPAVACKEKELEVTLQGDVSAALDSLAADTAAGIADLTAQNAHLQSQIDSLDDTVSGLHDQLAQEAAARRQGDEDLEGFAELLRGNLIVEGQTRAAGDEALGDAISAEAVARGAADDSLNLALGKETTARTERDSEIVGLVLDDSRFYRRMSSVETLGSEDGITFTVSCRTGDVALAPAWDADFHLIENFSIPNRAFPNPGGESWTIELTYSALDEAPVLGVLCYDMTP